MDEPIKCPTCGSTQITANKKGFSAGKAAAGVLIAGTIGMAAGGIGSSKVIITCLKCGHQFKPGQQASKVHQPLTLGGVIFMIFVGAGFLIPACGGSWWFLLIMPILGFICFTIDETYKAKKDNKQFQSTQIHKETIKPIFNNKRIGQQKVICSKCNQTNEIHFKYCRICGEMIDSNKMDIINDKNSFEYEKCENCHRLTPRKSNNNLFCINCKQKL